MAGGCQEQKEAVGADTATENQSGPAGLDTSTPSDEKTWHEPCPANDFERRMINVGDVSLNVACRGDGETTVVFLHGFPEFYYSWNAVINELADEYRLIAPDQRGYNLSDKPTEVADYELPLLTNDILTLLPLVSESPVILVAHDWGGPVGWLVAHTEGAHIAGFMATNGPHPLRFAELIATDPDQQAASAYMDLFRAEGAETLMTPDYIVSNVLGFLSDADRPFYMEALSQPGAITGGLNWYRANTPLLPEVVAELMNPLLAEIPVPVSVFWGLADTAVLGQNAQGLEPYAPDLVVETFEGVDHWIEHRIPKEVARGVRDLADRAGR